MTIGASIFLIAVGAILKFAVTLTVGGIDIQTVGVILMIAGAIGLVLGLFLLANARNRVAAAQPVAAQPVVYEDQVAPPPPPPTTPRY